MPVVAPVAMLAGSAISGIIGSNSAKSAANTQATAAGQVANQQLAAGQQAAQIAQQGGSVANTELGSVLSQQRSLLDPYATQGSQGLSALNAALAPGGALTQQFSFDPSQIANNPNYQFQLQQGMEAVQRAAAAGGTLNSGGSLKALQQYAQGLASNEIGQSYNQALNTFNTNRANSVQNISMPLQTGEYGTSNLLNALQNYGQMFSQNTMGTAGIVGQDLTQGAQRAGDAQIGGANATAAGQANSGKALAGMVGGLATGTGMLAGALPQLGGMQQQTPAGSMNPSQLTQYGAYPPQMVTPPTAFQQPAQQAAPYGYGMGNGFYGFPGWGSYK